MLDTQRHRRVLIVDRDLADIEPLREALSAAGCIVNGVTDGMAALDCIAHEPCDLIIVDADAPGPKAFELIERLRSTHAARALRVIIVSLQSGELDAVTALNLGADDYIIKPYSLREMVARVAAVLRSVRREAAHASLSCGGLVLDAESNRVTAAGQPVNLRVIEYRLLAFLMSHPNRIFNRSQLRSHVWGSVSEVDERTVDVYVRRLRKRLDAPGCEACIQTVRGGGYRFSALIDAR